METPEETGLKAIGGLIRQKNDEIRKLKEENAMLRGIITEAMRQQDREDREVFRLVHCRPSMSEGCVRVVFRK